LDLLFRENCKFVIFTLVILAISIQSNLVYALYFDFEDDAQLKQWTFQGTWKTVKDDSTKSMLLSGEGANEICALVGEAEWKNYTIECDASGQTDEISIAFRATDPDNFLAFMIAPSLSLSEFFSKSKASFDEAIGAKGDSLGVKIQEWHKYKLIVQDDKASIFVDGKEGIKALDIGKLAAFSKGKVGFRQWGDRAYYDNVLITGTGIPHSIGEPGAVSSIAKLATTWATLKQ
jgi:hypothetical protein